ncbi:CHAT domain-containing protein [Arthrobacter ginkgonis]|uniref:CHAT domain-containing protein n=1 Tax=Arthrobacter ginkgonis TaxID=1630594 RepID=UPI0031E90D05
MLAVLKFNPQGQEQGPRSAEAMDVAVEVPRRFEVLALLCRPGQPPLRWDPVPEDGPAGVLRFRLGLEPQDAGSLLVVLILKRLLLAAAPSADDEGDKSAEPPPTRGLPRPDADVPRIDAHVDASMPSAIQVGEPVRILVRLSLDELTALPGQARDAGRIAVDPARPVEVKLRRLNLRVLPGTPDRLELFLPLPGATAENEFRVMGVGPGPALAELVFTQGTVVPLAQLRLEVQVTVEATPPAPPERQEAAVVPPDPRLATVPVLSVDEDFNDGQWTLEYDLDLHDDIRERFTMTPSIPKAELLDRLYAEIDGLWDQTRGLDPAQRAAAFEDRLADLGRELAVQVAPPELLSRLDSAWDRLEGLAVLSSEVQLPWEILQLAPAGRPARFLGETGLGRWAFNVAHPGRLHARPGRIRYLCPAYPAALALPQAGAEADFLATELQATALEPGDAGSIAALLRGGSFDLLHFGGHGEYAAGGQRLLLSPQGGYPATALAADFPRRAAVPGAEPGPLVVLNACRLASVPRTGAEAFAPAFLAGGAAAFVGCLWSVGDRPARGFAEAFYSALRKGEPVSAAVRAGRLAARAAGDASWLAYTAYAHPLATVDFGS